MVEEKILTWWQPNFSEEDAKSVYEVVQSGYINEGEKTDQLCVFVQDYLNIKHVIAVPNGTQALYLALKSLGIGQGDEVIVPALTFIATASAVIMTGAEPVFVDVDLTDCNLLSEQVEAMISKNTKAIVPVHINGRDAKIEEISKIAKEFGLYVIEDAAEALGSKNNGRYLGTLCDVGIISLAPTKIITSGQGGLILTNDDRINDRITELKDHGRLSRNWNYHPEFGANFKFNDILAALALSQIKGLNARIIKALKDYNQYFDGLKNNEFLTFFETKTVEGIVPLWVDIYVRKERNKFIEYMKNNNIIIRPFWPCITEQKPYRNYKKNKIVNAKHIANHGAWLPSGIDKTETDIDRVIKNINQFW